jgi:hypothetical protein
LHFLVVSEELMAIGAQENERPGLGDPAKSHRFDRRVTPGTVLVIPTIFDQGKPGRVVPSAFIKDKDAMTSVGRIPSTHPRPAANFLDGLVVLAAGGNEHFERIESGDAAFREAQLAQRFELGVHMKSNRDWGSR